LSQTVAYLACAPKSNAATVAIYQARNDVQSGRALTVPRHLRDGHYAGADQFGHGHGYEYSHNSEAGVVAQDYLGVDREYYRPVQRGFEIEMAKRLQEIRRVLKGQDVSDPEP